MILEEIMSVTGSSINVPFFVYLLIKFVRKEPLKRVLKRSNKRVRIAVNSNSNCSQ